MSCLGRSFAVAIAAALAATAAALPARAMVGDTIWAFPLAQNNNVPVGVAYDDATGTVYVLNDGDAAVSRPPRIFVYAHAVVSIPLGFFTIHVPTLTYVRTYQNLPVPPGAPADAKYELRGLHYAEEASGGAFYTLAYKAGPNGFSQLWRLDMATRTAASIDLAQPAYEIAGCETFDVALDGGVAYIAYDPAPLATHDLRAMRGMLKLDVSTFSNPVLLRHIPTSGKGLEEGLAPAPSRGVAIGFVDGVKILFGTAGNDYLYAATTAYGRGLFYFDMPRVTTAAALQNRYSLSFGNGALWVIEKLSGADYLLQVDVAGEPYAALQKNRRVRHVRMSITSTPVSGAPSSGLGTIRHNYCLPPSLPNQGSDGTGTPVDLSQAAHTIEELSFAPSGDTTITQEVQRIRYDNATRREYASEIEFDAWMSTWRRFVYPHRVPSGTVPAGCATGAYTEDAPEIYALSDTATWAAFFERVKEHLETPLQNRRCDTAPFPAGGGRNSEGRLERRGRPAAGTPPGAREAHLLHISTGGSPRLEMPRPVRRRR